MQTLLAKFDKSTQDAIAIVTTMNPKINVENLIRLVELTNNLGGCTIVSIRDYSSEKSGNTELANHIVNIGANYLPMVEKSIKKYSEVTFEEFTAALANHNFDKYVIDDMELFQNQVKASFGVAVEELCKPSTGSKANTDIKLNKVLWFNTSTLKLSIWGQSLKKETTVKGEFKPVKSAPLTVTKNILRDVCNPPTSKIRRFNLGLLTSVSMQKEHLEIA